MTKPDWADTFAYVLFTCILSTKFRADLADWYYGDIIEAFMEGEDQSNPWSFGWHSFMSRVAPVQLTNDWDVRRYLLGILEEAGIQPTFGVGHSGEEDNLLYFDELPETNWNWSFTPGGASAADLGRFDQVLRSTVTLARSQARGLLFVGGWGWAYDMEVPAEAQSVLRETALEFITRHA